MKILGTIGLVLSIIALLLGAYLQFSVVPEAEMAEANLNYAIQSDNEIYFNSTLRRLDGDAMSLKIDFATMVMGVGLLAFLLSIVPAIKKINIAWVGVLLGLLTFFLGAAYGTHMFS